MDITLRDIIKKTAHMEKFKIVKDIIYNNRDKIKILNGYFRDNMEYQMGSNKEKKKIIEHLAFDIFVRDCEYDNIFCYGYYELNSLILYFLYRISGNNMSTIKLRIWKNGDSIAIITEDYVSLYYLEGIIRSDSGRDNMFEEKTPLRSEIKDIIWG